MVLAALAVYFMPVVVRAINTVSTDDAYVNGHVTFVAPRVVGQVMEVLVDDNMRVKKGSPLVRLDKEPYEVQLEIKKAAVATAEADQVAAQAGVRSLVAQARANRFKLDHAIEDVKNQVANLHANVATLHSRQASLVLAKANLKRREGLIVSRTITQEELDDTRQQAQVAEAQVEEAREKVYATRVSLGLAPKPEQGDLNEVPDDIYENFSTIRQALGDLMQSAAHTSAQSKPR